jgi:hypothetical protein
MTQAHRHRKGHLLSTAKSARPFPWLSQVPWLGRNPASLMSPRPIRSYSESIGVIRSSKSIAPSKTPTPWRTVSHFPTSHPAALQFAFFNFQFAIHYFPFAMSLSALCYPLPSTPTTAIAISQYHRTSLCITVYHRISPKLDRGVAAFAHSKTLESCPRLQISNSLIH